MHLAQRLDIGREPGEAVRGMLVALQPPGIETAARRYQRAHPLGRPREQRFGGIERCAGRRIGLASDRRGRRGGHGHNPV